jgi:hypothetical protein
MRHARGGPAITIILVADTFRAAFPEGLEPFLQQTVDPGTFELVLVDWAGGTSYRTLADRVLSHPGAPRITYLRCPVAARAAMNNLGLSRATTPLVGFCADDFVPSPSYVAAHLAYHAAHPERTRVAIGPGFSPPHLRAASPFLAWLEDSGELFGVRFREPSPPLPTTYFYLANVSLKRSFCDEAGPFDERLPYPAHDDLAYGRRLTQLGMVAELIGDAACVHEHLITLSDRRIQLGWAGASAAILGSGEVGGTERRQRPAWLDAALRQWSRALGDGPRSVGWRLSLGFAFLTGYGRQMLKPLRPRATLPRFSGSRWRAGTF